MPAFLKKCGTMTYHIILDGNRMEVSVSELQRLKDEDREILLDVQWYLEHGGITHEEFVKTHTFYG